MKIPSRRKHGRVTKAIRVSTNDPSQRNLVLQCTGTVRGAFAGSMPDVRFRPIDRSSGPQSTAIELRRGDAEAIKPEIPPIADARRESIDAVITELVPGERYRLDVTVKPPWPNGDLRTILRIKTGVDQTPWETVSVSAPIEPRLRLEPKRFTLPYQHDAETEYSIGAIWHRTAKERKIVSATCTDPALKVRIEPKGDREEIVLTAPKGYTKGRAPQSVVLVTNDEEVPQERVVIAFSSASMPPRGVTAVTRAQPAPAVRRGCADDESSSSSTTTDSEDKSKGTDDARGQPQEQGASSPGR